jgi:hypothetical protein
MAEVAGENGEIGVAARSASRRDRRPTGFYGNRRGLSLLKGAAIDRIYVRKTTEVLMEFAGQLDLGPRARTHLGHC